MQAACCLGGQSGVEDDSSGGIFDRAQTGVRKSNFLVRYDIFICSLGYLQAIYRG